MLGQHNLGLYGLMPSPLFKAKEQQREKLVQGILILLINWETERNKIGLS